MCGIASIVSKSHLPISPLLIKKMTNVIHHRGPDGEGHLVKENFALGHRRLAIIDLTEEGSQPMSYWGLTIVFNGEIYNYLELKEELQQLGYIFATHSDTEVILASYHQWGQQCLERFVGMWSFVLYDQQKNILFGARDRFGVKPFLYTETSDYFLIGSEIKQFITFESFKPILNKKVAYDYLSKGFLNHNYETFFEGVFNLPGGYLLVYNLSTHKKTIDRWYKPNLTPMQGISFETAAQQYRNLLSESIRLRERSDVQVGAALSGGLDSSAIVCLMNEDNKNRKNFQTITSCYSQKEYDEQLFSDAVTQKTGFAAHKVFPDLDDLLRHNLLDVMVWHQEQPFSTASHFSEYKVFEAAQKNNIRVMLLGQGSDEHSAGYPVFYMVYHLQLLKSGRIFKLIQELKFKAKDKQISFFKTCLSFVKFLFINALLHWAKYGLLRHPAPALNWYSSAKLGFGETKRPKPVLGLLMNPSSIRQLSQDQVFCSSIPYQVHSEDRNSMLHSIESRAPFLDHRLVEFMLKLPDDFKIRRGQRKAIMRKALNGVLPDSIRDRTDKMGFVAPDELWFKQNPDIIQKALSDAIQDSKGIFTQELILSYQLFLEGKRAFDDRYMKVLTLSSLIRQYKLDLT